MKIKKWLLVSAVALTLISLQVGVTTKIDPIHGIGSIMYGLPFSSITYHYNPDLGLGLSYMADEITLFVLLKNISTLWRWPWHGSIHDAWPLQGIALDWLGFALNVVFYYIASAFVSRIVVKVKARLKTRNLE